MRVDDNRNLKIIIKYHPEGKRAVQRPRKKMVDFLNGDLKATGRQRLALEEMARDREHWKDVRCD